MNYTPIDFLVTEIGRLKSISEDDADRIMRAVANRMDFEVKEYHPSLRHDAPEPSWMRQ